MLSKKKLNQKFTQKKVKQKCHCCSSKMKIDKEKATYTKFKCTGRNCKATIKINKVPIVIIRSTETKSKKEENQNQEPEILEKINGYLDPEEIENIAKKHKSEDIRKRKLTLIPFVLFTIFSSSIVEKGSYLPQVITELKRIFDIDITKQALSKQMVNKRSWKVFRDIFNNILKKNADSLGKKSSKEELTILNGFKDILIPDSSSFKVFKTLLKKYKSTNDDVAGCKLNILFSFSCLQVVKAKITQQKTHDNNFKFVKLDKGMLYLFDLGYWCYKTFQKIIDRKSFFISRLKKGCNPTICSVNGDTSHKFVGKKLSEVKAFLQDNPIDFLVKINGIKDELRVVGLLHNSDWYFYLTNISDSEMTPQIIYEIYRIRWQVELFFKWIKTHLNSKELCMRTDNSLLIEIYATLIYSLIVMLFVDEAKDSETPTQRFSVVKAINIVKKYSLDLIGALFYRSRARLSKLLPKLLKVLRRKALKECRPKRENPLLSS